MHTKSNSLIYRIVIIVLAVFTVFGFFEAKKASALKKEAQNNYMRAFYDLADSVESIDSLLEKIMIANNPTQLSSLASDIYANAEAAKACLGQLPLEIGSVSSISKFLSHAGDYTAYISAKITDSGEISEEEFNNLMSLASHAETVDEALRNIQNALLNGSLSFDNPNGFTAYAAEGEGISQSFEKIEKEFQSYPSLIYDGPFSEHIEKAEPEAIKGMAEISENEALEIASMYLGENRSANLFVSGKNTSTPESYFIEENGKAHRISAEITKQGGMPLWFLDNRTVSTENLSIDEAKKAGAKYLRRMGYPSMTESYYEKNGNVATINYAYVQDDVVMYSDLIKLKVALDNGEILGFEARGYVMSHKLRTFSGDTVSARKAQELVNPHLSISAVRLAMIPLESKREVLCYEFSGEFNKKNFLIYINAVTGKEEKILILTESENGILTI